MPAGDGDEGNRLGVVSDLLDESGSLLDDLVEAVLGPLAGVHLVDGNDELLDTEGEGEKSVLTGLTILGDTSLELTVPAAMMRIAQSAWEVPVIMFLMKSR